MSITTFGLNILKKEFVEEVEKLIKENINTFVIFAWREGIHNMFDIMEDEWKISLGLIKEANKLAAAGILKTQAEYDNYIYRDNWAQFLIRNAQPITLGVGGAITYSIMGGIEWSFERIKIELEDTKSNKLTHKAKMHQVSATRASVEFRGKTIDAYVNPKAKNPRIRQRVTSKRYPTKSVYGPSTAEIFLENKNKVLSDMKSAGESEVNHINYTIRIDNKNDKQQF